MTALSIARIPLTKRHSLIFFAALLAVQTVWLFQAEAAPRPNILVLLSDDQRADTIAALGNRHIQTPHLDTLVRGGTTFTRAYCMGAMQGAVCVPSRAMLMTGRSLFRVKENMQSQGTWPEAFAYFLDIFPTLGALAKVAGPDGSEGLSLGGVIFGESSRVREEVFLACTQTQRSIRDERWKLMRFPQIGVSHLFDLESDTYETRNLAGLPAHSERVANMMSRLERAQVTWADQLPLTATNLQPAAFVPPQGAKMEEMFRKNMTR